MTAKKPFLQTVLFLTFVFYGCSQSDPVISYGSLELVYYENGGSRAERFSFFILPQDDDGIEDLEELYLYHDWEGLSWQIKRSDWVTQEIDGKTWIGSRAIVMNDRSALPRGQFRAVLADKGGARSEKLLSFDAPPVDEFPSLEIFGERYRIVSRFPRQNLLLYDDRGNYLSTRTVSALEGPLSALDLPQNAKTTALWAYDSARSVSALTDVVPLYD
jgi:hypothetical protein